MHDRIKNIRADYDRLAATYAEHFAEELQHKPLDRELLQRFANEVRGRGQICDMGCGPGHVTRYLHQLKLDVSGLDLSPEMIEQARRLHPDISFHQGDMLALQLPDEMFAGIVAFYAIVNLPEDWLPQVFRGMYRVLEPGGLLLLTFHIGGETLCVPELLGHKISMEFHLFPTANIRLQLEGAGFEIEQVIEREPYAPEVEYQSRRAYIFARRPSRRGVV